MWLLIWQKALIPQVPGHGSTHFIRVQALFKGQSEFTTHSGRHPSYGLPKYPSKHWQEPTPLCSLHIAFEPHGLGLHGFKISFGIRAIGLHCENGSPVYPSWHIHIGEWLTTLHSVFVPQLPTHGSAHFWLRQAKLWSHSLLLMHSGLQFGGVPRYPGKQAQTGPSPLIPHVECEPQGEGSHGSTCTTACTKNSTWLIIKFDMTWCFAS